MNEIRKVLSGIALFSGLAPDELDQVLQITLQKKFARGETVFVEGDRAVGFYVVRKGRIKIYKVSSEGKEHILHIFGGGHPFGEVPVFTGRRFPASAQAIASSELLFLPRRAFVDLIAAQPSLALNMLAVLSMRLHEFTLQIENLSLKEVPGRLASYLMYLASEQDNPRHVELKISKGQLASVLGTVPETLSRIFARLSDSGLISVRGRAIELIDADSLRRIAASGRADG